jgi:hypothetical protein
VLQWLPALIARSKGGGADRGGSIRLAAVGVSAAPGFSRK